MSVTTAINLYILVWGISASVPILMPYSLKNKALLWGFLMGLVLICGYFLDNAYQQAPHTAWQQSSFYVIFGFISVFLTIPALLYQKVKQR